MRTLVQTTVYTPHYLYTSLSIPRRHWLTRRSLWVRNQIPVFTQRKKSDHTLGEPQELVRRSRRLDGSLGRELLIDYYRPLGAATSLLWRYYEARDTPRLDSYPPIGAARNLAQHLGYEKDRFQPPVEDWGLPGTRRKWPMIRKEVSRVEHHLFGNRDGVPATRARRCRRGTVALGLALRSKAERNRNAGRKREERAERETHKRGHDLDRDCAPGRQGSVTVGSRIGLPRAAPWSKPRKGINRS
jgi:hypothetical protein